MSRFLKKCQSQKTISIHLVVQEIEQMQGRYDQLEMKYKELLHYSNKHKQLLQSEIKRLKAAIRKLREQT